MKFGRSHIIKVDLIIEFLLLIVMMSSERVNLSFVVEGTTVAGPTRRLNYFMVGHGFNWKGVHDHIIVLAVDSTMSQLAILSIPPTIQNSFTIPHEAMA